LERLSDFIGLFPFGARGLRGAPAGNEMKDKRNHGQNEQQVNQSAGDVKHQESARPREKKQDRD
jgi:hypothetical protein